MHKFFDNPAERVAPADARVPASVSLGGVEIRPATVLAPMAGVTDTVFRRFIRNLGGCGLMMTEFTSADGITRYKDKKAKQYLTFYGKEHPISAQLFGSDGRGGARGRGPRLRPSGPQPRLSREEGREVQWRLGTAARSAAHPQHLRISARGGDGAVHGEVPSRLERQRDGAHQPGEDGRGVRTGRCR